VGWIDTATGIITPGQSVPLDLQFAAISSAFAYLLPAGFKIPPLV
jgi:hypothetical protein